MGLNVLKAQYEIEEEIKIKSDIINYLVLYLERISMNM